MSPPFGPDRRSDLICLSHLRWDFVYQRPQHLMTRCARDRRVFFVEEPEYVRDVTPHFHVRATGDVTVVVPQLPEGCADPTEQQRLLLDDMMRRADIHDYVLWYYTPMALAFTRHLAPAARVYDCMDELSAFKGAPPALRDLDAELMRQSTLVLTGGQSLYEAKRDRHHNIHAFPSSVDVQHFAQARRSSWIRRTRRRFRTPASASSASSTNEWISPLLARRRRRAAGLADCLIGPVVKIDPASLPQRRNIHYLGGKTYEELPHYIAGWDVALLPFARNAATRFISPTKTPEYLAAGKPVVSTSIRDVVRPYGEQGLVRIADDVPAFVRACTAALHEDSATRQRAGRCVLATDVVGWHLEPDRMRCSTPRPDRDT